MISDGVGEVVEEGAAAGAAVHSAVALDYVSGQKLGDSL